MQELVSQIFTYQDARYDHCHKGISSGMTIFHVEGEWVKLSGQCFLGGAYKTNALYAPYDTLAMLNYNTTITLNVLNC